MIYKEAIRQKANYESTFIEGEITYRVFVTPESHDDLIKYLTDIRGFYCNLKDSDAKRYSKNKKFALYGLCYLNKGPKILYKQLEY
jgi:hypothetical protein